MGDVHIDKVDVKMDIPSIRKLYKPLRLFQLEQVWEKLTWVWVVWADRAQQVFLFFIVTFAEQLPFLKNKFVPFPQLSFTNAAAEAA